MGGQNLFFMGTIALSKPPGFQRGIVHGASSGDERGYLKEVKRGQNVETM